MGTLRKAIWSGKCVECAKDIKRGDLIYSEKGEGSHHEIRHLYCPGTVKANDIERRLREV